MSTSSSPIALAFLLATCSNALQAHSTGQEHSSFVHYIAARAYQQQNQQQRALAEFKDFLKEEPKGPRADQVRADSDRADRRPLRPSHRSDHRNRDQAPEGQFPADN